MLQENLERNFGFLVHDVARLLRVTFDRRVKELGLTRSQWWVLTHLFRNDGITQSELADVLEVERPTLGRLLDRMEANGWVRRQADTVDRRAKRVFLTAAVEPPMRAMRAIAAEVRADALNGLGPKEQEYFVDALLSIKSNLSRAGGGGNGSAKSASPPPREASGAPAAPAAAESAAGSPEGVDESDVDGKDGDGNGAAKARETIR